MKNTYTIFAVFIAMFALGLVLTFGNISAVSSSEGVAAKIMLTAGGGAAMFVTLAQFKVQALDPDIAQVLSELQEVHANQKQLSQIKLENTRLWLRAMDAQASHRLATGFEDERLQADIHKLTVDFEGYGMATQRLAEVEFEFKRMLSALQELKKPVVTVEPEYILAYA